MTYNYDTKRLLTQVGFDELLLHLKKSDHNILTASMPTARHKTSFVIIWNLQIILKVKSL